MVKDQLWIERRCAGDDLHPENLSAPIFQETDILQFESPYNVSIQIPCCITSCRTPHNRGWIVRLCNGEYSRVGHDCAKRFLGSETFTTMQRDFDKRLQRANRLKYISSPNFDPAAAVTALLKWGDRVEELETFYSALAITFP